MKIHPLLLILTAQVFSVSAQLLLKKGMNVIGETNLLDMSSIISNAVKVGSNLFIVTGLLCFGASLVFWLTALSRVDLSYAYPLVGMGYIVIVLSSWLILGETVSLTRWLGVFLIVGGVFLVARS